MTENIECFVNVDILKLPCELQNWGMLMQRKLHEDKVWFETTLVGKMSRRSH